MSNIECQCKDCGQWFQRVVLQGADRPDLVCPKCHSRQICVAERCRSLFDGIKNFSALATDTN